VTAAIFTPRARRDVSAAARWIKKDNRAAARALREAVAQAAERIGRHPRSGVVRVDLLPEPYRFVALTGFPYVIVYDCERNPPMIVAVLHTSRRDLKRVVRDL
jgi:toxin ParE1/3/4